MSLAGGWIEVACIVHPAGEAAGYPGVHGAAAGTWLSTGPDRGKAGLPPGDRAAVDQPFNAKGPAGLADRPPLRGGPGSADAS